MHVIEVLPVAKNVGAPSYSYFSSVPYERGTLVSIPLRSKTVPGIVLSSSPATGLKTALRAATFTLRKLPLETHPQELAPKFLALIDELSRTQLAQPSAILSALLPKNIELVLPHPLHHDYPGGAHSRVEVLLGTTHDRFIEYRRLVREAFANNSSVVFVAPTLEDVLHARRELSVGIEKYTVTAHSLQKTGEIRGRDKTVREETHPLLIITTPLHAFFERNDVGLVILERSRAKGYRLVTRPYLDLREALLTDAKLRKRAVVLGDLLLETETEYRLRENKYSVRDEHPKRLSLPGTLKVITQKKDHDGIEPFRIFSPELIRGIEDTIKHRGRVFLFAARRGLAPVVGCADCGLILRDPESGAPLSLYRAVKDNVEERWLVSATSGYRIRAKDTCPNCNSWRLRERGIGIQHVESELRKLLPRAPIILFDHTTAKTHAKAEKLKEEFYGAHGTILLGTALALPYLEKPVTTSAVVSMDSLLSLPSWRQTEESFGILLTLREKTDRTVWIQVRHRADEPVIQFAARGEISNFYDEELLVRKEFLYPPYSTFVLLSYSGSLAVIKETEENLGTLFKEQAISFYGMPPNEEGKILRHGLMRLNPKSMADAAFVSAIHSLSPAIKVEVNPDRIL